MSSVNGNDSGACRKGPPGPSHVTGGLFKVERRLPGQVCPPGVTLRPIKTQHGLPELSLPSRTRRFWK